MKALFYMRQLSYTYRASASILTGITGTVININRAVLPSVASHTSTGIATSSVGTCGSILTWGVLVAQI